MSRYTLESLSALKNLSSEHELSGPMKIYFNLIEFPLLNVIFHDLEYILTFTNYFMMRKWVENKIKVVSYGVGVILSSYFVLNN